MSRAPYQWNRAVLLMPYAGVVARWCEVWKEWKPGCRSFVRRCDYPYQATRLVAKLNAKHKEPHP